VHKVPLSYGVISTIAGQVVHSAVLVRFEEMNDDLGMCVWLSISPSTHDALFRSQHPEGRIVQSKRITHSLERTVPNSPSLL